MSNPSKLRGSLVAAALTALALGACSGGDASPGPTSTATGTNATKSAADVVVVLLQQGISQAQQGKTDEAVVTFNNVLSIDPGNQYALYNLGVIAQGRNDSATALSYYDKALATDANYTPAMFNKAILLESGKADEAIALYEKIVQINSKAATAYLRVSALYAAKGQQDKAKDARDKAIAIDANLATVTPTAAPAAPTSTPATPGATTTTRR